MADTTYTFSRLKVEAKGIGTLRTHGRVRYRVQLGTEVVTDATGWPRGELEGDYQGTSEVELTTQEALDSLVQLATHADRNPLTVTETWAPRHGKARTLTFFLRLAEFEGTDEKERESMLSLNFVHVDVMEVDGKKVREDLRVAA